MIAVLLFLFLAQAQDGPAARLNRADEDLARGRYREAVIHYTELAAALPRDPRPSAGLGAAQLGLHHPELAIGPLERALAIDSNQWEVRLMLAGALSAVGRNERAVAECRKVTAAEPSNARAWYLLGRSLVAAATQAYRQLLDKAPQSAYGLAVEADGLMRRLQYTRAIAEFRQALAKDPGLLPAQTAIAAIYRELGHEDWAEQEEAALGAVDCASHQIACEAAAGKHEAVLAAVRAAQSPAALYWRGQAYSGLAAEAFRKLEQLPPSRELHLYRAGLHWEAGRRLEMVDELRAGLRMAPGDREVRRNLATALGAAGFYDEAYQIASDLLRDEPDSSELNALAGDALLSSQKAEEAIPFLRKAVVLNPASLLERWSLGRAYMQTGEAKLALPQLEAAVSIDTDGTLHHLLASAYQQTGQVELAKQALSKYQELARPADPPAQQSKPR